MTKTTQLFVGALLGILSSILAHSNAVDSSAAIVIGTTISMAFFWITTCIPIYVTALLPLAVFPLAGIVSMSDLSKNYMSHTIMLFIGGFLMAYAIERCGLHKRIAYKIIALCSASYNKILFGFMLASAFLSMWILNTATVTMLLPAVLAVLSQMGSEEKKMAPPLLLGIAYASSIGGMATLVGTLPNAITYDSFNTNITSQDPITFLSWMKVALPLSIILFAITYFVLKWRFMGQLKGLDIDSNKNTERYNKLGHMSHDEKWVGVLFALMAILWITMKEINFGSWAFPGWTGLFPEPAFIKESTVALFFGILLFLIPSKQGSTLLTWQDAQRLPIGVLFLFGAGYALVAAFKSSGVNSLLESSLIDITTNMNPFFIVFLLCLVMTFLTELTSNTTSMQLFALILIGISASRPDINPLFLFLPVTFCASCAFMLPVATPPNTIVFGSGMIHAKPMLKTGLILNLISVAVITIYCLLILN